MASAVPHVAPVADGYDRKLKEIEEILQTRLGNVKQVKADGSH